MVNECLWVQRWIYSSVGVKTCLWFVLFVALVANAQEKILLWEYPGEAPFVGSPEKACQLFAEAGVLSIERCLKGQHMLKQGKCDVYYLQDGEVVTTTFTRSDKTHHLRILEVAFKHAGLSQSDVEEPLPDRHLKRLTFSCRLGGKDNKALALPFVCGNWTVHNKEVEKPSTKKGSWQCPEVETLGGAIRSGSDLYLRSIESTFCRTGVPSLYIPRESKITAQPGTSEKCQWVPNINQVEEK